MTDPKLETAEQFACVMAHEITDEGTLAPSAKIVELIRARDRAAALKVLDAALLALCQQLVLRRSPVGIIERLRAEYEDCE